MVSFGMLIQRLVDRPFKHDNALTDTICHSECIVFSTRLWKLAFRNSDVQIEAEVAKPQVRQIVVGQNCSTPLRVRAGSILASASSGQIMLDH